MTTVRILVGDCKEVLQTLPDASVQCVVTSPPYWNLRDYGIGGQLGLEPTPELYVKHLVETFREVWRVLRDDGVLWLNLGDSYWSSRPNPGRNDVERMYNNDEAPKQKENKFGAQPQCAVCGRFMRFVAGDWKCDHLPKTYKPKDLVGIPWRVAFALQADGWWLRSDVIWHKPNCMPESVTDRPTKSHEYVFLLTKSARYFYDSEAIREEQIKGAAGSRFDNGKSAIHQQNRAQEGYRDSAGRNKRTVWTVPTQPFSDWVETSHQVLVELDDVSDGMMHIASPGCPVHGCRDCLYDDNGACDLIHTQNTDARHAQEQGAGLDDNSSHPDKHHWDCSLDSQNQTYSPSATDRNSQSRKTGRAPGTSQPCTPCAETPDRIEHTSELPVCAALQSYIPDCNTWPGEMDVHLLDQIPHRTVDKSSLPIPPECLCGFYHTITKKTSHFATFPPALIEPMIKAGTSERGCCPECGAAWKRVTERTQRVPWDERKAKGATRGSKERGYNENHGAGTDHTLGVTVKTTGWQPSCACGCPEDTSPDDFELVATPTGKRTAKDPSMVMGRAGYNRPRGPNEGRRLITRYEQRCFAKQLRTSPNRDLMAAEAGTAFDHYIRTDNSGARPIPPDLLAIWLEREWIDPVDVPEWMPPEPQPCIVLDPFAGAGTTGLVAARLGRDAILIELNPDYAEMARKRIADDGTMFTEVVVK